MTDKKGKAANPPVAAPDVVPGPLFGCSLDFDYADSEGVQVPSHCIIIDANGLQQSPTNRLWTDRKRHEKCIE